MRSVRRWLGILAACLIGGPVFAGEMFVAAPGRVEPVSEEVHLSADASGVLASVAVSEGEPVAAGQVVAILANADQAARLAAAEAGLRAREADLQRLLNGALAAERAEARAAIAEARAVLEAAGKNLKRARELRAAGWATPQALEKAERDHGVAVARRATARQHLATIDRPPRLDDIARAEAEIDAAAARVAEARALFDKTVVRSPIDGIVLRRFRHPGEMVSIAEYSPILAVGDLSKLRVRAEIEEADVARVAKGQPAHVTAPAFADRRFAGRVVRVGGMMGRKLIRTERPDERMDTKVLEVLIELEGQPPLPVGLRVDAFILGDAPADG